MNFAARVPTAPEFGKNVLVLDAAAEVERIVEALREQVLGELRRRGAVVGLSGGIDSSVVAALVRARARQRQGPRPLHARAPFVGRFAEARPQLRGDSLGIETVARRHRARARGARLLPPAGRGDPHGRSRVRRRLEVQARAAVGPRERRPQRHPAHGAEPATATPRTCACRRQPTCSSSPRPTSSSACAR